MKIIFTICLAICFQFCPAQNNVLWLKKHLVPFSPDPPLSSKNDFSQLKKYIGDAQIVMLGEQTHGDGTTFKTKVELIKFLHKEMGFDVLAWESNFFNAEAAYQIAQTATTPIEMLRKSTYGLWGTAEQVQPLFHYINDVIKSEHPLTLTGIDCQLEGSFLSHDFLLPFLNYIASKKIGFDKVETKQDFVKYYYSLLFLRQTLRNKKEDEKLPFLDTLFKKQQIFLSFTRELIPRLDAVKEPQAKRFSQHLKNIIAILPAHLKYAGVNNLPDVNYQLVRDSLMAENLIWLQKTMYPGKKIVVWAASSHISTNAYQAMGAGKQLGDFLLDKKINCYRIGFTAYEGRWQWVNNPQYKGSIEPPAADAIESLFSKTGADNFFLDLKTVSAGKEGRLLRNNNTMRPFGYRSMSLRWPQVFEAIIFNKTMEPATLISK